MLDGLLSTTMGKRMLLLTGQKKYVKSRTGFIKLFTVNYIKMESLLKYKRKNFQITKDKIN